MATAISRQEDPYIVIDGVSWESYDQILAALGEHHLRHCYDRGTLEMRSLLYGVTWGEYEAFLRALPEHYLRHTFDRGCLEMMAPSREHEWIKRFIGRLIEAMALELDIPIQSAGSTTQRRRESDRGLQPDESYYVASEPLVSRKRKLDLRRAPPPDLAIEVDVTYSTLSRMEVYASLRIPEVWRYDGRQVTFNKLATRRKYQSIQHSVAFPFLTPADILRAVDQLDQKDENTLVREFVRWAKRASAKYKSESTSTKTETPAITKRSNKKSS
ncbi:MAG TPA: Uma2 family endonuclease [Pirellulales bacterium]